MLSLRERKRIKLRWTIQAEALWLFEARGPVPFGAAAVTTRSTMARR